MSPQTPDATAVEQRRLLAYVAASLVAGGATVTDAELEVRRLGVRLGHPDVQVSGTPTVVTLALGSGEPATVERVEGPMNLGQSLRVGRVRRDLMDGRLTIPEGVDALRLARRQLNRYGLAGFAGGNVLVAMGICLIMQPGLPNVAACALCSLIVSALMRGAQRHALLAALLPTVAALLVSLVVIALAQAGLLQGPLRTLICPIAVLLPGATLSTGIAELATGSLISGTSRFSSGIVQLLLFALGVVTAQLLLGASNQALTNTRIDDLGPGAALVGIVMIALGIALSEGLPWGMAAWSSPVLLATFATQTLGQSFAHSLPVGAFAGAVVASFVSTAIEARRPDIPRLVVFLPSFWLLVPGTLGLMGVTTVGVGTGQAAAVTGVVTLVTAIALGLLVGSALALPTQRLARRVHGVVRHRDRGVN